MIHIGISGPIASGKSYLGKQIKSFAEEEGYAAEIVPFAYGVRELAELESHKFRKSAIRQKLFDWGYDDEKATIAADMVNDYMLQFPSEPGVKNRRLLQSIGTEVGRHYLGEDTWVIRTQQIARRYDALDFLISDDMRFDNEALAVDVHIAVVVEYDMNCYRQRISKLAGGYVYNNHPSENGITLPPLLTIPVCFRDRAIERLFLTVDRIRKLRYD